MADYSVVNFGGILLWSNRIFSQREIGYINELIKKKIIESLSSMDQYYVTSDNQVSFHFLLESHKNLIFIISYPAIITSINRLTCNDVLTRLLKSGDPTDINSYRNALDNSLQDILLDYPVLFSLPPPEHIDAPEVTRQVPSPQEDKPVTMKAPKYPSLKQKKIQRKWEGSVLYHNKEDDMELNFGEDDNTALPSSQTNYPKPGTQIDVPDLQAPKIVSSPSSTLLVSIWNKIHDVGKISTKLTSEHLVSPLNSLKDSLIKKNVAEEVASKIIRSVEARLLGQDLSFFTTAGKLNSIIKEATSSILEQILTSSDNLKYSCDLFLGMAEAKEKKRPFIITLVGVNGVGKSTSLSKLVYWTLQRGFSVLVVAGDTFRSGAVEQLSAHVTNLMKVGKVALFQKGYGKDASFVAKEAISFAQANNFDVILIDTAGRMQDNLPLMKSLSRLISASNPDRIIFVGEALVGNEALDQLTKFNSALISESPPSSARVIDGIILTKFDTIDDKVGAAVSMSYVSGAPIIFVGVGQTYMDLRRLNVSYLVDSLLK